MSDARDYVVEVLFVTCEIEVTARDAHEAIELARERLREDAATCELTVRPGTLDDEAGMVPMFSADELAEIEAGQFQPATEGR
jgi:hypothetical protein